MVRCLIRSPVSLSGRTSGMSKRSQWFRFAPPFSKFVRHLLQCYRSLEQTVRLGAASDKS